MTNHALVGVVVPAEDQIRAHLGVVPLVDEKSTGGDLGSFAVEPPETSAKDATMASSTAVLVSDLCNWSQTFGGGQGLKKHLKTRLYPCSLPLPVLIAMPETTLLEPVDALF